MAEPGPRYRSLIAAGLGTEASTHIIESVVRARGDLEVHELAPGRLAVSRTRRPTWAVVACACTVWIGGLGLLFLLVKQTESGEVNVIDGPRGATVTLPPLLDAAAVHALEEALRTDHSSQHDPDRPDRAVLPRGDDGLEGRTVARGDVGAPSPVAPPMAPPRAVLRFDGAVLDVEPGRPVVLGRDPSPTGDAVAWRVPGDATTVSKSHLLVTFDGTTVTVEDLGSTNGSTLARDGATRPLAAGAPATVLDGDRISVGAVDFVVDIRATRPEVGSAWS